MKRIYQAIASHLESATTNDARRLFHGRGHTYTGLEHINVDYYPPTLLITLFQQTNDEFDALLQDIKALLADESILLQHRYLPKAPTELVHGCLRADQLAHYHGMQIQLNLGSNQNIGYFIDMQTTHDWVRDNSRHKNVLNLFSYTCLFSVAALQGGATQVVNVDMAAGALNTGRHNHQLNKLDKNSSKFLKLDILKSWSRIKKPGPYQLLIIDPPCNQPGSFSTEKDYRKILRRIPELVTPGGQVLACLNAPHLTASFLQALMAQECPTCTFVERLPASPDFPEQDQQRSLKTLLFNYT